MHREEKEKGEIEKGEKANLFTASLSALGTKMPPHFPWSEKKRILSGKKEKVDGGKMSLPFVLPSER